MKKNSNLRWIALILIIILFISIFYNYNLRNLTIAAKHLLNIPCGNYNNVADLLNTAHNIFKINIKGIIHIGAHEGQEKNIYKKFNINHILWIEADPTIAQKLQQTLDQNNSNIKVANFAASNFNGTTTFLKSNNNGLSSSILKLKKHKILFPSIKQTEQLQVTAKTLDNYLEQQTDINKKKYNVLVLDIQGTEIMALEGAKNTLNQIDCIISEVLYDELYENGATIYSLDKFLLKYNFVRIDTRTSMRIYGDALYIKKNILEI